MECSVSHLNFCLYVLKLIISLTVRVASGAWDLCHLNTSLNKHHNKTPTKPMEKEKHENSRQMT